MGLFQDVRNARFLRQQLLDGNGDFEYAFIDAEVIISTTHALAGVFRAANDYRNGRLRSRNVHSEIVFALGPNNNIAESFRKFGISDTTSSLLVIKLSTSPEITHESVKTHLETAIQGESIEFCDENLAKFVDVARVRKVYKLNGPARPAGRKKQAASDAVEIEASVTRDLEMSILGLIALKGAA